MAQPRRVRAKHKPKTAKTEAERIAALYVQSRTALVQAGRILHDHVGSSLSAAGVQLQLLRADVPAAQAALDETLQILEQTLDRIRRLSNDLCPSPAHRGALKQALLGLSRQNGSLAESKACEVAVEYSATAAVPAEIAAALYEAAHAAVELALHQGATRVTVTVRGSGSMVLRIADNGRKSGRTGALSAIRTIAREQGLAFECTTGKSTIVSIRYAIRRAPRG